MSRIEIPLDEYNTLKQKIRDLEKMLNDNSNQLSLYQNEINNIEKLILNLKEEGIINRVFNWQKIIKPLMEILKREKIC